MNENHDERGRFTSGPGSGGRPTERMSRGKLYVGRAMEMAMASARAGKADRAEKLVAAAWRNKVTQRDGDYLVAYDKIVSANIKLARTPVTANTFGRTAANTPWKRRNGLANF